MKNSLPLALMQDKLDNQSIEWINLAYFLLIKNLPLLSCCYILT